MDPILNKIIVNIVNPLIYLLFVVASLYFLYGVYDFIRNAESPGERKTGGSHILWGTIGLAIMFSAWAIIRIILSTIGKN
jgi:hypothetical protein